RALSGMIRGRPFSIIDVIAGTVSPATWLASHPKPLLRMNSSMDARVSAVIELILAIVTSPQSARATEDKPHPTTTAVRKRGENFIVGLPAPRFVVSVTSIVERAGPVGGCLHQHGERCAY